MSTHTMLAEETVSITDFRKSPKDYFTDHPIAVLSNNRPAGYVIGAAAYEALVAMLTQTQETASFEGRFKPTAERMKVIAQKGVELLAKATEEDLEQFSK
ncbi:MAG: type I toxin-antitoxin system antitoxin YafN [Sedimenticola sp.]